MYHSTVASGCVFMGCIAKCAVKNEIVESVSNRNVLNPCDGCDEWVESTHVIDKYTNMYAPVRK